jgi:AcrR family transcriptional regulator
MDAAKKDCILVEAARAFARWGFKKASVDDIARAAGVAKGTVYLAAESKEDLFYQALHREVREQVAAISRAIDPRIPADELLAQMSAMGMAFLEHSPLVRDLLLGKAAEVLPPWSERFAALRLLGATPVLEVLRLGIRQGLFRPDLDVETLASMLQDLQLTTYIFHSYGKDPERGQRLERRQKAGLELVLEGLRVKPSAAAQAAKRDPAAPRA